MKKLKTFVAVVMAAVLLFVQVPIISAADLPEREIDGEIFVPIRQKAYLNYASVYWNSETLSVYITFADGNSHVINIANIGGFIEDGRAWIPLQYSAGIFAAVEAEIPVEVYELPYEDYEPLYTAEAFESTVPLDVAASLFREAGEIWDADGGDLWGFPIHAPLMIADPISRHAVANMADEEGYLRPLGDVYVGILPGNIFIGHTMIDFGGLTWGLMSWEPFVIELLENQRYFIINLLIHEGFHAIQFHKIVSGNIPAGFDQSFEFLNHSAIARITVLMEAAALENAVRSEGSERQEAIRDALSVRAHRRMLHPEDVINENGQEINEGLAMFTEVINFENAVALMEHYMPFITDNAESTGLSMFPYLTGAAYALLLYDTTADWRTGITFYTDLAAILQEYYGVEVIPFEQLDLERLGYYEFAPIQHAWVLEYQAMREGAEYFHSQPWILIEGDSFIDEPFDARVEVFFINDETTGWQYLIFFGDYTHVGANWILTSVNGFTSPSWFPNEGINVRFYDDIEIQEDGLVAIAPTWRLEITDPSYKIMFDEDGQLVIVGR